MRNGPAVLHWCSLTSCDCMPHCVQQVLESSGVQLMADSQYDAQNRIQTLLEFLHEREMDIEDLAEVKRVRLEQCIQLCQLEKDANQVRGFYCGLSGMFELIIN